jgi:transcriptional regulator with XRE-family HTH domain
MYITAEKLIKWREQKGWTQSGLANALGVRHSTIFRWETGRSQIPPYMHLTLEGLEISHLPR